MVNPLHLYGWVCGRELNANLFNFQFLPVFYARRDISRDGVKLKGTLLDLGCGSQPYRPYLKGVVRYVGLDYPATRACLPTKPKAEVLGDARTIPFADQTFDGVLCSQVLEHVDRPERVIQEMSRILKPGGVGLISVPFFYNLHMEPYDYFRFSPYGIRELLERNGLAVRVLRAQGGIGTLLVQMFHNWLFSGMARWARHHMIKKAVVALISPLLLLLSALDNLVGLALDHLSPYDLRFTPNLWVVAEKMSS
jgi:SAM-dependent methyltransferase|uniref:Class I SAM-dependent methyltransferase n=1 Tax=Desulfobacca acetoxidans TaxID=60893 RepID=A0A7V6DR55_9BACT